MADLAKRVLVVDDELPILEAVAYGLRKEGLHVLLASNAEACLRIFREDRPDLLILDVMLPSASGLEVCRKIRETSSVPIILLTARADEGDKIKGLDLGADDYVTKPFSVRELVARVKANLRRQIDSDPGDEPIKVGHVTIDERRHEVLVSGRRVDLAPKEFALLAFMARHPDIAFTRQTLLDRVWGADAFVDERTVDVHVRWLRSKVERDPSDPHLLLTVRGIGYKLAHGASV